MTDYPKVSVIIPMYNAARTIDLCVKSALAMDYPDFEVIVADDASTDGSASLVSGMPCKLVILDKNSGPGMARNKGVESASGEIVAFMDADCKAPGDWLRKIVKNFEDRGIGAVSGGYSGSSSNGAVALFQFYDTCFRQRNLPRYINSCITANFASRKGIFEEIGGFPARRINEDMEFGLALSEKYKILWDKNNGVLHHFNNNPGHYFREQILWSESAVESCLSLPKAASKAHTWSNREIFMHLLLTGLFYMTLTAAFWKLRLAAAALLLAGLYFLVNMDFIKFIAGMKGFVFALKIFPLMLVRNTAWLLGVAVAVIKHSIKVLRGGFIKCRHCQ